MSRVLNVNRLNTPPGSPAKGDVYLVGAVPTGAWAGQKNMFAEWNGAAWVFYTPPNNQTIWNNGNPLFFRSGGNIEAVVSETNAAFFRDLIVSMGRYSQSEVNAGFLMTTFTDAADLPTPPPSGIGNPAFAVVTDGSMELKLYYWDFVGQVNWIETTNPWNNPIMIPGHVLVQDPSVGSGSVNWAYAMGLEVHIQHPCEADALAVKYGSGGFAHSWELLKSTAPGPTAPALSTYTDRIADGVYPHVGANTWEDVTGWPTPPALAVDDWIIAWAFVGTTSGQSAPLATVRSNNQTLEDFGIINAGIFTFISGAINPGPIPLPLPTTRISPTLYGMVSVNLGAP